MFFFFNDTATTEIYTLSLHDALPIFELIRGGKRQTINITIAERPAETALGTGRTPAEADDRSEEHTSELQSRQYLVCRLLLEKKDNELLNLLNLSHVSRYGRAAPAPA